VKPRRSYAKLRDLGKGAHAEVDEVRDKTNNQVYARKTYKLADGDNYETLRSRFRDELRIVEKLSTSSNSARYLMVGLIRAHQDEENREFSLILWPVAEGSLRDLLTATVEKPLTITASTLRLLDQFISDLANGLRFIHGEFIRHKDIKPENILMYKSRLLYPDFGISLDFGLSRCSITNSDKPCYTAAYAAPELLGFRKEPRNCKSDVFSLGCVFYELLAT
jgi:serine/threonine protein kinase